MKKTSLGIDLGGCMSGNTAFAVIEWDDKKANVLELFNCLVFMSTPMILMNKIFYNSSVSLVSAAELANGGKHFNIEHL